MQLTLTGKVAVITGVSRKNGISAAIATRLARAGATIFTTDYRPYDIETALGKNANEALPPTFAPRSGNPLGAAHVEVRQVAGGECRQNLLCLFKFFVTQ